MISSTYGISSSDALLPVNLPDVSQAPEHVKVIEGENLIAYARVLYTTVDDPTNHLTPIGDPYDGVTKLILPNSDGNTYLCSGALLPTGQHVLTAAHCVTDNSGNRALLTGGTATFAGDSGSQTIPISGYEVYSAYDGDFIKGNDIAILILEYSASNEIVRYNYATSGNAVGQVVSKVGYGLSGFFSSGTDRDNYPSGIKRDGINEYDALADVMYQALGLDANSDYVPGAIYQYDSDDGSSPHDAFGFFFGISDTGQGNNEVLSAPGDSGGPTLVDTTNDGNPDTVVGITSYGISLHYTRGPPPRTSDCTNQLDSSCGEFAGDTRVSHYADFIASVLNTVDDVDPPIISAINVDASSTTATITWTTSESATSQVDYDTDDNYDSSVSDSNYVTSHSIELTGLLSSTDYHFMVTSVDASNHSASSVDTHFTTELAPILKSITLSPDNTSITKDSTQQFTVTGTYSDGTSQVLTVVTWSSSDSNVATIDGTGLATGISVGLVTITANSGGLTDTTSLDVTAASEEPTTVSVSSVTYSGEGGKNGDKHLLTTIALLDNLGDPVSGASVSITLKNIDTGGSWSGTATTGSDGSITFSLKNAPSGCYTTTVTDVTASGLQWSPIDTPLNEECKQQTNNAKNSTPSVIKSKN